MKAAWPPVALEPCSAFWSRWDVCNSVGLLDAPVDRKPGPSAARVPSLTPGAHTLLTSCWHCKYSLKLAPWVVPTGTHQGLQPSFTLCRVQNPCPGSPSPEMGRGSAKISLEKAVWLPKAAGFQQKSPASLSSFWAALSFLQRCSGRQHKLFGTFSTFLFASSFSLLPSYPTQILCWLTNIRRFIYEGIDQKIPTHTGQLCALLHKVCLWHFLHAQTEPVCKAAASSSYQSGPRPASGHSGSTGSCPWSPDTLPRQHGPGWFSLALICWTQTSPAGSLSLFEWAPSQKELLEAFTSSSSALAAFRLKDVGSAQWSSAHKEKFSPMQPLPKEPHTAFLADCTYWPCNWLPFFKFFQAILPPYCERMMGGIIGTCISFGLCWLFLFFA